jgi:hypothetical protein
MKQLIEDLISAMEYHVEQTRPVHMTTVAIQAAKDALKAMEATPPAAQRQWVSLDEKDFDGVVTSESFEAGARWADSKLREKNGGAA